MLKIKALMVCIIMCLLSSACEYIHHRASPPVQRTTQGPREDCNKQIEQMNGVMQTLHNKANSLEIKNKELALTNNTLRYKSEKLEMELNKRAAVIQVQGNVIKLLDDPEKTIETGLTDEINAKIDALEEARKNIKQVFTVDELFIPKTLDISESGRKKLLALAGAIKDNSKQMIYIEGHTDNVPVSASVKDKYPTNWEISISRATAVARFLQKNAEIDPARLVVVGHGPFKPVASNETEEGRQKNRRVEIFLGPPL